MKINKYNNFTLTFTAIGELPICMAVVIAFALREAIVAARHDAGIPTSQW